MIGRHPRALPAALAPFATTVAWAAAPWQGEAPTTRDELVGLLQRFQRSTGGTWQPACSLWAQMYFNALIIPTVCLLEDQGSGLDAVAHIRGTFCPTSGAPLRFTLHPTGEIAPSPRSAADFVTLQDRLIEQLIAELHAVARLSPRMLWESATLVTGWTLDQLACGRPASGGRAAKLLARSSLVRAGRPGATAVAFSDGPRRFCCLRKRLPGYAACAGICPLAERTPSPDAIQPRPLRAERANR